MDREQVLDTLQAYQSLLARIKALNNEIDELHSMAITYGNVIGDGMPHGSSGEADAKYTRQINKIFDLEQEQKLELLALQEVKENTLKLIYLAPTRRGRDVLELRYRYGWSVKKISEEIGKSDTNVRMVHNRAITKITERINDGNYLDECKREDASKVGMVSCNVQ